MHFHALGKSPKDISSAIGLSEASVKATMASPLYQSELKRLQDQASQRVVEEAADAASLLQREAVKSVNVLLELRDYGMQEGVRRQSAVDILDRAGYGKVVRAEHIHTVVIPAAQMRRLDETYELVKSAPSGAFSLPSASNGASLADRIPNNLGQSEERQLKLPFGAEAKGAQ